MSKKWRLDLIFDLLRKEIDGAIGKFRNFHSAHEGYAIVKEELDEMWDAIKMNDLKQSRHEAIQVAAMAIRYLYDITDQNRIDNTWDGKPK